MNWWGRLAAWWRELGGRQTTCWICGREIAAAQQVCDDDQCQREWREVENRAM